ncbi:MAG: transcriptional repressor LexA [Actinomycetota bacterium]|jgi:repressor LexA
MSTAFEGLSPKQEQIMRFIIESVATNGYPPSMREIGAEVELSATSSVSHQLNQLEKRGLIRRGDNMNRAIEVLVDIPTDNVADIARIRETDVVSVPLVGRIAAGGPITAEQNIEDTFALPRQIAGKTASDLFMLEVHGDSMIDAAICDGDWVVVRQQNTAANGEIVAALLDGEATVKVFKQKDGQTWLLPRNSSYDPIDGTHAQIQGKVISVIRKID